MVVTKKVSSTTIVGIGTPFSLFSS